MKDSLNLWERAMLAAGSFFFERKNGYRVPFSGELLRTLGFRRVVQFQKLSGPIMSRAVEVFGERDAQVLCAMSALWNGCPFCSVGHMLAANLLHLRATGTLFAIPEAVVPGWRKLRDSEILSDVHARLDRDEPRLAKRIERSWQLRDEEVQAQGAEDASLRDLAALWSIVTECSVHFEVSTEEIPALATVARDRPLRGRYRQLRNASISP